MQLRGRQAEHATRHRFVGGLAAAVLVPLLLGACGGDDGGDGGDGGGTTEQPTATTGPDGTTGGSTATTGAAAVDREGALTGTWEGSYTCGSGTSRLTLTVLDVAEGDVEAFFAFSGLPADSGAPAGSFRMTGTNTDGTLSLEGLDWVEQPDGFSMVGLEADTGARADTELLEGTLVGGDCETFTVGRIATDPWYVGDWEGGYICAQGRTALTLTVEATGGNTVSAVVGFSPLEDNPGVATGSYSMEGAWVGGRLGLRGVEWIEQPPGYVMVDVNTNPDIPTGPDRLAGAIEDPSCEAFILERVAA